MTCSQPLSSGLRVNFVFADILIYTLPKKRYEVNPLLTARRLTLLSAITIWRAGACARGGWPEKAGI